MFITLYGINNIGKSTQARLLVESLKKEGFEAVYIKYPVYDIEPSGPYLNQLLRQGLAQTISEEELQMWFTLNRFQFEPTLKKWLSEGKIVVAEDYTGTGLAWGMTKGASLNFLENLNQYLLKEDLALLLDGDRFRHAEEKGHLHESDSELMLKSRDIHLMLAKKYGWSLIPVEKGIEKTFQKIFQIVIGRLKKS